MTRVTFEGIPPKYGARHQEPGQIAIIGQTPGGRREEILVCHRPEGVYVARKVGEQIGPSYEIPLRFFSNDGRPLLRELAVILNHKQETQEDYYRAAAQLYRFAVEESQAVEFEELP